MVELNITYPVSLNNEIGTSGYKPIFLFCYSGTRSSHCTYHVVEISNIGRPEKNQYGNYTAYDNCLICNIDWRDSSWYRSTHEWTFTGKDGATYKLWQTEDKNFWYQVTYIPPLVSPVCVEGTTRRVKCPTTQLMITQKCTGNTWVTIKADETKCDEIITPSIPGGYTEIRVLNDTMIEAWYQCYDPTFPCPSGNATWTEFSRSIGSIGSHGGCGNCSMTEIVWIKTPPVTPPVIPPVIPCTPSWGCEVPRSGYEMDGCSNRRLNTNCNSIVPPVTPPVIPPLIPPVIPQTEDYTTIILIVIAIVLFIMISRK